MDILENMLTGKCVYWPFDHTGDDGMPVYGDADEIACRWEDKTEAFMGPGGTQVLSNAIVYVSKDLLVNSVLCNATMNTITDLDTPLKNKKAFPLIRFDKIPTLDGDEFLRQAYL